MNPEDMKIASKKAQIMMTPLWPDDERDFAAMEAAAHALMLREGALRDGPEAEWPAFEVKFYDARTVIIFRNNFNGSAFIWAHRLGAPSGSQPAEPAILLE